MSRVNTCEIVVHMHDIEDGVLHIIQTTCQIRG